MKNREGFLKRGNMIVEEASVNSLSIFEIDSAELTSKMETVTPRDRFVLHPHVHKRSTSRLGENKKCVK